MQHSTKRTSVNSIHKQNTCCYHITCATGALLVFLMQNFSIIFPNVFKRVLAGLNKFSATVILRLPRRFFLYTGIPSNGPYSECDDLG